jgi:hypothetical protein
MGYSRTLAELAESAGRIAEKPPGKLVFKKNAAAWPGNQIKHRPRRRERPQTSQITVSSASTAS